jgi:hypothetical protein
LSSDVLANFAGAFPASLRRDDLLAALQIAIESLIREATDLPDSAGKIGPRLSELVGPFDAP